MDDRLLRSGKVWRSPYGDSVDIHGVSGKHEELSAHAYLLEIGGAPAPIAGSEHPRPRGSWREIADWPLEGGPPVGAVYEASGRSATLVRGLRVISTRVLAVYPYSDGIGLQDHVSISCSQHRPSRRQVEIALAAFGMVGTEEDNHHPGIARHFWRAVDPAHRVDCQCKASDTTIVDGSYAWTNPVEGPCRGCEFTRLSGRPCPLHSDGP